MIVDQASSGVDRSQNTVVRIPTMVGFRTIVPDEPLHSKSVSSKPDYGWPKVKMTSGTLYLGLIILWTP